MTHAADKFTQDSAPMRAATDLEIWTYLMGMAGWMDITIVEMEEAVELADEAEAAALEGLR